MGIHSTMFITREDCFSEIMKRIYECSDDVLANILFDLVGDEWLNNFRIIGEYEEEDKYGYPIQYDNRMDSESR